MAHPTAPAAHSTDARLDQITQVLRLMLETQQTHTEMLAKVIEAATPSEESSLEGAMRSVAVALRDQTNALVRVQEKLGGLGREIEAGVVRGMNTALGIDPDASDPLIGRSGADPLPPPPAPPAARR
ncbi:hypothetical protein [Acidiphilium sp.]|uniref:hypothetical protein n=1 Tax=Acidiphilium sp. TaxID=527 RepID=UPI003D072E30